MTPPNVNTSALRTLHRIHRQIADLKGRRERGPKQVRAAKAHVQHQEGQFGNTEEQLKAMRIGTNAKQLQLKAGEDKIKDLQVKLNAAASNREYQALKDQIAAQKVTNSVLDDEILETWEKIEQFEQRIAEAKDA
ncbi:MAG: phospholipase, partial [Planctomycetota bacterium]